MPDYRKFKVSVNGRAEFAAFLSSLRDQEMKQRIDETLDLLKERPDAGDLVKHELWPEEYRRLGLDNLFRIGVGKSQRMTYSMKIEGERVTVLVIEFFASHKEYDRRFHYHS